MLLGPIKRGLSFTRFLPPSLPPSSLQGYFSEDNVELGGLTINQQAFAEVTDASGLGAAFMAGSFDGILG